MTHRSPLDEAQGPVPIEVLTHLPRVSDEQTKTAIHDLPEPQRAELAMLCCGRGHMRDFALTIAALCQKANLSEPSSPNKLASQRLGLHKPLNLISAPLRWLVALDQPPDPSGINVEEQAKQNIIGYDNTSLL